MLKKKTLVINPSRRSEFTVCQGLIQDLNLGGDMNISSHWSITDVKKYCRQIGLLCSILCLVLTNVLYFKRGALFLGTTFFV